MITIDKWPKGSALICFGSSDISGKNIQDLYFPPTKYQQKYEIYYKDRYSTE